MKHLNITNQERLRRYPSGKCPLCGNEVYVAYIEADEGEILEHGMQCTDCEEKYRIEQPSFWIDSDLIYRQ